jgi:hypothetical protein
MDDVLVNNAEFASNNRIKSWRMPIALAEVKYLCRKVSVPVRTTRQLDNTLLGQPIRCRLVLLWLEMSRTCNNKIYGDSGCSRRRIVPHPVAAWRNWRLPRLILTKRQAAR